MHFDLGFGLPIFGKDFDDDGEDLQDSVVERGPKVVVDRYNDPSWRGWGQTPLRKVDSLSIERKVESVKEQVNIVSKLK